MYEFYTSSNLTFLKNGENIDIMPQNELTIHTVFVNETTYGEYYNSDYLQGFILISFCVIGTALCYLCGKTHDYVTERYYTNQMMAIYESEINNHANNLIEQILLQQSNSQSNNNNTGITSSLNNENNANNEIPNLNNSRNIENSV